MASPKENFHSSTLDSVRVCKYLHFTGKKRKEMPSRLKHTYKDTVVRNTASNSKLFNKLMNEYPKEPAVKQTYERVVHIQMDNRWNHVWKTPNRRIFRLPFQQAQIHEIQKNVEYNGPFL